MSQCPYQKYDHAARSNPEKYPARALRATHAALQPSFEVRHSTGSWQWRNCASGAWTTRGVVEKKSCPWSGWCVVALAASKSRFGFQDESNIGCSSLVSSATSLRASTGGVRHGAQVFGRRSDCKIAIVAEGIQGVRWKRGSPRRRAKEEVK